jgi:endonuclease/exonuclease/phosphatase family metal-dependent hydrolase
VGAFFYLRVVVQMYAREPGANPVPVSMTPAETLGIAIACAGILWVGLFPTGLLELAAGRRLHVVNLHLRAPLAAPVPGQKKDSHTWRSVSGWAEGFFLATVKRAGQALETRLFIERIFDDDPEALVAVCGDFNAEERQTPLRTIRGDPADTGNAALEARALVPLDRTLPASQRFSVVHGGHKEMLDHVLVSRALLDCYRHVEVHNEGLADELSDAGPASHHAPLVAEFAL